MPADDVLQDQLCGVLLEGKSICTASDGINLIDDVGGIDGYIEFLRTLKSGTKEEKTQLREWAKIFGWTGRRKKPENML